MADYSTQIRQYVDMVFEKASSIYRSAKSSQDASKVNQAIADLRKCVSDIQNTINGYNNKYNSNANIRALQYAREKMATINGWISELQQINTVANHGSLDGVTGEFADDRTQGWVPTSSNPTVGTAANIGDILVWLKNIYDQNSHNAQNAAYLDAIIELLSGLQSQQWQQASDDLAYSRTNYDTLVAQYMASGMSRAAAMQAASGSMPSVAGSSVPGLGSDILGGVAADQTNAVGQRANDINAAAQATNAYSATNAVWQKQQELQSVLANINAQTAATEYDLNYTKTARENMEQVLTHFYTLTGNNANIPFSATVNTDSFIKYVASMNAKYVELQQAIENGDAFISDGRVYATTESKYGKDQVVDSNMLLYDIDDLSNLRSFNNLNYALTNLRDPGFNDLFNQFFFSTAGPRYYFQHQAQLQMDQNKAYLNDLSTKLSAIETKLASEEFTTAANSAFFAAYMSSDESIQSKYNDLISKAGLSWSNGVLVKLSYDDDGNSVEVPATYDELENAGLISIGFTRLQRLQMISQINALLLDTNPTHFGFQLNNMLLKDQNDNNFLNLQGIGAKKATKWITNTSIWSDMAGAKTLLDITGMGAAAAGAFHVGLGLVSGGASLLSSISKLRSSNASHDNYYNTYVYTGQQRESPLMPY